MSTPTQKFETVRRDSLYFGQYQHQCRFLLAEASALRRLDHDSITEHIQLRRRFSWRQIIAPDAEQNLHEVCDQLLALENPYKTTVSGNLIYFYTNSMSDIDLLSQGKMKRVGDITQVIVTHQKGTVGLLNPKYTYRTYFRSHKPSAEQLVFLDSFIKNCQDEIKPSPGLVDFFKQKSKYSWLLDHHYIDHNDMKMVTAMALSNPRLVGKTKPIVKVNN